MALKALHIRNHSDRMEEANLRWSRVFHNGRHPHGMPASQPFPDVASLT